jgi:Flp pilus assembly protein TadB
MREKLQNAPWWVWSLIMGLTFGSFATVFNHFQQPVSWTAAIIGGLIGGVLFGAVMGPWVARQRRKALAASGDMPFHDRQIANRAVMRGPVPLDPEIRQAAARLSRLQLKQYSPGRRWLGVIFFGALNVLYGLLALTDSPWWWIAFAIFLGFGALNVMLPRHLQRRLEMLSQEV